MGWIETLWTILGSLAFITIVALVAIDVRENFRKTDGDEL